MAHCCIYNFCRFTLIYKKTYNLWWIKENLWIIQNERVLIENFALSNIILVNFQKSGVAVKHFYGWYKFLLEQPLKKDENKYFAYHLGHTTSNIFSSTWEITKLFSSNINIFVGAVVFEIWN